ncbi:MAG: hypothetical protein IPI62_14590 [Bacteroidetes bacterium]|nr:hypothetical protein [Bacteroidota bacterium]
MQTASPYSAALFSNPPTADKDASSPGNSVQQIPDCIVAEYRVEWKILLLSDLSLYVK